MKSEIVFSMKIFFSSYPKGDPTHEEILKFHTRMFKQFQFRYADQAFLDGKSLDDEARRDIMAKLPGEVKGKVTVYGEPDEILFVDRMISLLEPLRIDLPGHEAVKADHYLKFLKERKENISRPESKLPEQKEYNSLRRVYSFILTEAFLRGMSQIQTMSKPAFIKYVKEKFKVKSGNSIYQTVRSTYKGESNFINFIGTMKQAHSLDYEYAMEIFHEYYPDLA